MIDANNIKGSDFLWVVDTSFKKAVFDCQTGYIWNLSFGREPSKNSQTARQVIKIDGSLHLDNWELPDSNELVDFISRLRETTFYKKSKYLKSAFGLRALWLVKQGVFNIQTKGLKKNFGSKACYAIPCSMAFCELGVESLATHARKNKLQIAGHINESDKLIEVFDLSELIINSFLNLDSLSSPLPKLDSSELTDPSKGLWELWGKPESELKELGIRARDPAQDVQPWPVAIDFGTSSTVVAYRQGGKKRLLRVGVKDFFAPPDPAHFENPTLLELVDFQALLKPWQETAYRPAVRWGDVRSSHEALANLRDNEGETAVTASMITKLKHWALRLSEDAPVILMDRTHQQEIQLPALTLRNPVKGQPLNVSTEDPFDPIELYAFFLGLAINWRKQGIYLRYYMTFPVAYPQAVKEKILASFRRGLQRSLPEPLIEQEAFNQFTVKERASEPAAFAAAALPFYDLEPTPEGLTYAVFDFGGGTTDFDYGIYREPTPEEEDEGYETVFEHFGASGDAYLGGENLLENLAYRVFEANQKLLREKRIAITCPLDAEPFPGSEMLLDRTQAAVTNTQMLVSRLRPFWEENKQNSQGIEKIKLLNRAGEEVVTELVMPYEELSAYLQQRLEEGVDKFLTAMRKAFNEHDHRPEEVHVFLAGNASRSRYLQDALEKLLSDDKQRPAPVIDLYDPIDQQTDTPFQPTAKTGVALGLLDLCPGSRTLVINHAHQKADGEAPFAYYVGRIRRRKFQPVLKRHASYGKWQEVGVVIDGHFDLVYSLSPLANEGRLQEDSSELSFIPLELYQADRQRLFVRALAPDRIEVCTAASQESLEEKLNSGKSLDNLQSINLR